MVQMGSLGTFDPINGCNRKDDAKAKTYGPGQQQITFPGFFMSCVSSCKFIFGIAKYVIVALFTGISKSS